MPLAEDLKSLAEEIRHGVAKNPKVGEGLANEVRFLGQKATNVLLDVKSCKLLKDRFHSALKADQQIQELPTMLWNEFEGSGVWDSTTEKLVEKAKEIATPNGLLDDAIDAAFNACGCNQKLKTQAQVTMTTGTSLSDKDLEWFHSQIRKSAR